MTRLIRSFMIAGVALAMFAPLAAAQAVPDALKVQVVVSRQQGEKKVSSMPYTLSLVAGDARGTSLRMGVNVPLPAKDGAYTYHTVGTNIDCSAVAMGAVYKLNMTLSDTSVFVANREDPGAPSSRVGGVPSLRTFTGSFALVLRDGQTSQHTTATDPLSGEVLKIDVTLNVIK